MKVIDLLNKIANGEEIPKKIKFKGNILYYNDDYIDGIYYPTFNYYDKEGNNALIEGWLCQYINDEIEVIEEPKKIEKLPLPLNLLNNQSFASKCLYDCIEKVNEIIDYTNKENK